MVYIKINLPSADFAASASATLLKSKMTEGRLDSMKSLKTAVNLREDETGYTNYAAHVFDAAIYYANGLNEFTQLEAKGTLDNMDLLQKMYMQDVLNIAATVSARSAFQAARQYNNKNVRRFKVSKVLKTFKRALGF